ncbi:unnamed protein product [Albugo candida]|uniref:dolichol kinase n=1 Tax=Albugo candida TaxID=65357 RepID=A0A024GI79_9STRA|nr:unnamed protein product [Albugo candida]|eukprot:CCI46237.1 unnamed protein product [Albugo candida]
MKNAILLEAFVLLFASLWAFYEHIHTATTSSILWTLQFPLQTLAFGAFSIIFHPQTLTRERDTEDSGWMAGVLLPPLALISRQIVEGTSDIVFLAYAHCSLYIGLCILLNRLGRSNGLFRICISLLFLLNDITAFLPFIAWKIFSKVLAFGLGILRRSITLGEGILIAQGFTFFLIDFLLLVSARISNSFLLLRAVNTRDNVARMSEVALFGGLLIAWCLSPLSKQQIRDRPPSISKCIGRICMAIVGVLCLCRVLLSTWNPFQWLVSFLHSFRLIVLFFWILSLILCLPLFQWIAVKIRQIIARKLFHGLVVVMFFPVALMDTQMLCLSYSIAITLFILTECVRVVSIQKLGATQITAFMSIFVDHREAGSIVLTHTYLLLGCALPLWLSYDPMDSKNVQFVLPPHAGILALGIGDAMGAVIGSLYGRPRACIGFKSVEGTLAVFLSISLASIFILRLYAVPSIRQVREVFDRYDTFSFSVQILRVLLASGLTSVFEATSSQIDNLTLPLLLFTLLNLASTS